MSWRADKGRLLEWLAGILLAAVVSVLCYDAARLQAAEDDTAAKVEEARSRSDRAEGRAEINDQLLKEVRDDVKKLLQRVPEH